MGKLIQREMHQWALRQRGKLPRGHQIGSLRMGSCLRGKHQLACCLQIQTQLQLVLDVRQCLWVRQTLQVEHLSLRAFLKVGRRSCRCQMGMLHRIGELLRDELQLDAHQKGMHRQMVGYLKESHRLVFHLQSLTQRRLVLDGPQEMAPQT